MDCQSGHLDFFFRCLPNQIEQQTLSGATERERERGREREGGREGGRERYSSCLVGMASIRSADRLRSGMVRIPQGTMAGGELGVRSTEQKKERERGKVQFCPISHIGRDQNQPSEGHQPISAPSIVEAARPGGARHSVQAHTDLTAERAPRHQSRCNVRIIVFFMSD